MSFSDDYSRDTEFRKLMGRRDDVDLAVAALELARDAYPDLDFAVVQRWIGARSEELRGPLARASAEVDGLTEISLCLSVQHGLCGDPQCYDSADSSFLHKVIEHKRGLPISLSLLYMAVAAQAGWTLQGVSAPGHFLIRYESMNGPVFLDPFHAGQIVSVEECVSRVQSSTGMTRSKTLSTLQPASPRTIIVRMLNNLKALYARREQWGPAMQVQRRLVALQPASFDERRDLALITLRANQPGQALKLLESCLGACPSSERKILEQQVLEAQNQIARWN